MQSPRPFFESLIVLVFLFIDTESRKCLKKKLFFNSVLWLSHGPMNVAPYNSAILYHEHLTIIPRMRVENEKLNSKRRKRVAPN